MTSTKACRYYVHSCAMFYAGRYRVSAPDCVCTSKGERNADAGRMAGALDTKHAVSWLTDRGGRQGFGKTPVLVDGLLSCWR